MNLTWSIGWFGGPINVKRCLSAHAEPHRWQVRGASEHIKNFLSWRSNPTTES